MRRPFRRPARPPDADAPDLLAEAEARAFDAAVRAHHEAKREDRGGGAKEDAGADAETEADWQELEGEVYKPEEMPLEDALRRAEAEVPPALKPGGVFVVVSREAMETLQAHLREDTSVELGGLLAGRAFRDPARNLFVVKVETVLPARDGIETATSFAYTGASWQAILPGLRGLPPGSTVVGSYHSHPGLGVFLSPTDRDTQADVFPHPWQIALVVDPIADTLGFFAGPEGEECGYSVFGVGGEPLPEHQTPNTEYRTPN